MAKTKVEARKNIIPVRLSDAELADIRAKRNQRAGP